MRYGDEGLAVATWLVQVISEDPGIQDALGVTDQAGALKRVWEGTAPEGTPFPFITFQVGEPQDWNPVGPSGRVFSAVPVTVKGTDEATSYAALSPIAQRLYALLVGNHNTLLTQGGLILTGHRDSGIQYPEQVNGVQYRHLGGLFQIITQ